MSQAFTFIAGESFNGAVARWADTVGGLERMIDLTRVAGVRYGHHQRAAAADEPGICALASEMDVDAKELLSRAMPNAPGDYTNQLHPLTFYGVTIPSLLVEKNVRRFSPAGLAVSPHHRALWDLRLIPVCTVTGEVLLDSCGDPECGKTGWTATLGIDRCEHCMTDLTQATTTRIPDDTRKVLAQFAGLFSHDLSVRDATVGLLPPNVASLGPDDIIDLLMRVTKVVDRDMPVDLPGLRNAPPLALASAIATSWAVLVGWPGALTEIVSDHVALRTGCHNDGNAGRTMRFLSPTRQAAAGQSVLTLISDWRRSISVDHPDGAVTNERTVPGGFVAEVTKLDTAKVVEYRRLGIFKTHFVLDSLRPEARYDVAEIEGIRIALSDRCSVGAARLALGMSSHGVEQLVAMKLLDDIDHPYLDFHYGERQISRSSVDDLISAVRATSDGAPARSTLTLRSAMKAIGGHVKPWGPVFAMLVAGELPIRVDPDVHRLTDAIFIDDAVIPLLRTLRLPDKVAASLSRTMSKVDAAELLNLSALKITELLSHIPTAVGSHSKAVALEVVERLAKRHIAVAEIAARRNVSPARAYLDAIAACIPYLGAGGFCRNRTETDFFKN